MATAPGTTEQTADQRRMTAKLHTFHRRYRKAVDGLAALEDERSKLYVEARSITPPLTFREIAGVFGVTEAAVMQKIKRNGS